MDCKRELQAMRRRVGRGWKYFRKVLPTFWQLKNVLHMTEHKLTLLLFLVVFAVGCAHISNNSSTIFWLTNEINFKLHFIKHRHWKGESTIFILFYVLLRRKVFYELLRPLKPCSYQIYRGQPSSQPAIHPSQPDIPLDISPDNINLSQHDFRY